MFCRILLKSEPLNVHNIGTLMTPILHLHNRILQIRIVIRNSVLSEDNIGSLYQMCMYIKHLIKFPIDDVISDLKKQG